MVSRPPDTPRKGEHCDQPEPEDPACVQPSMNAKEHERKSYVELLLDSERPGVKQGLLSRRRGEIAGLPPKEHIRRECRSCEFSFGKVIELCRQQQPRSEKRGDTHYDQQRRKYSAHPSL